MKEKKKKIKNNAKSIHRNKTYELFFQTTYLVFMILFCGLLILYMHDGYFDLMESKASCFRLCVMILSPFLLVTLFFKIKEKRSFVNSYLDLGMIALAVNSIVSTLLSYSPKESFSGDQGWYVGSFVIVSLVLIYFVLKDESFEHKYAYVALFMICLFEFAVTILDSASLDVLNLRSEIYNADYHSFYGTIGNSNWYVGFASLLVPFFVCMFLGCENIKQRIAFGIASLLGLLASVLNGADGIYLAFGFCAFFAIPYAFDKVGRIRRFLILTLTFMFFVLLIKNTRAFADKLNTMSGFGRILFYSNFTVFACVVLLLAFFAIHKLSEERYELIKRKAVLAVEIIYGIGVLLISISFLSGISNGGGTGRLPIWQTSIYAFLYRYPFTMKLFGIGPELLRNVYSSLSAKAGAIYNSSHSEPIHMLMSMGLFGLFSWLFCWGCLFMEHARKQKLDLLHFAVLMGIFAYFGQSFVNSATIPNLCILLLFVFLFKQDNKSKDSLFRSGK